MGPVPRGGPDHEVERLAVEVASAMQLSADAAQGFLPEGREQKQNIMTCASAVFSP